MDTFATLVLAGSVLILSAIQAYGEQYLRSFVAFHRQDLLIALVVVGVLALWKKREVSQIAFYCAFVGALYLLSSHLDGVLSVF